MSARDELPPGWFTRSVGAGMVQIHCGNEWLGRCVDQELAGDYAWCAFGITREEYAAMRAAVPLSASEARELLILRDMVFRELGQPPPGVTPDLWTAIEKLEAAAEGTSPARSTPPCGQR